MSNIVLSWLLIHIAIVPYNFETVWLSEYYDLIPGKLVFRPFFHQPRIYENAPPGVHVTTVHAYDPDSPRKLVTYEMLQVRDHDYFNIDEESGNLTTFRNINKTAGGKFEVIVVASSDGISEFDHLTISVTEFNQFAPQFEREEYEGEIHINTSLGTPVLRVYAHDDDPISQNAEVYYRMDQNESSKYFQLNQDSGELSLYISLHSAPRRLVFGVFAEDGGSPKRWAQAQIKLFVKTISEPVNVTISNITESSAKVCWFQPLFGETEGYVVTYHEKNVEKFGASVKNITSTTKLTCTVLGNLRPQKEYVVSVTGRNPYEIGQASVKTSFTTTPDFCRRNICKRGKCFKIAQEPGYRCECDNGFYGKICDLFDPCSEKPCGEYGVCHNTSHNDYHCECLENFSGKNCSDFNPCAVHPSPCKNGGVCEMIHSREYRCRCRNGYSGETCQDIDACFSSPCSNSGICHNLNNSEYRCQCGQGYSGKNCEYDVEECSSSPCKNGGSCLEGVGVFSCQCSPGYYGTLCERKKECQMDVVQADKGTFSWNSTEHGTIVLIKCPFGTLYPADEEIEGYAKRSCLLLSDGSVQWSEANANNCRAEGFRAAEELAGELQALTSNPDKVSPKEFQQAASQIESIVQYAVQNQKLAYDMVSVLSNMLDVNDNVYEVGDEDGIVTKKLVQVVDTFASNVKLSPGEKVEFFTPNIVIVASNPSDVSGDGLAFSPDPGRRKRNAHFLLNSQIPGITLPNQVFNLAKQIIKDIRVKFVSYKNDKFFRSRKYNKTRCRNTELCHELKTFPDRQVLQASINNISISNLTDPVVYAIPTDNKQKYLCVYWNDHEREWSLDGLITNQTENKTFCFSNHLTAFSVLLDPTPYMVIPKQHEKVLSIISYIGCALSLTGLFLTILTYSLFGCLHRDHSGKILLNLCISLALMNVSFLLGSHHNSPKHGHSVCLSVAILTHYFLLTSLAWMCVEAVNMYQLLIHVFASAETHFLLKRFILAWGGPFVIVSIAAGIDINQYSNQNEYCMLSPSNPYIYYISFLGPSCVILLANLIVFVMVTKVLFTPRMTTSIHMNRNGYTVTAAQVRGAFTVMVLLGVTWIFGAFAVGEAKLVFQYLFCIANSLQGFLIFIVRCLHYHEARNAWLQLFQTGTLKKYRGVVPPGASWCTNSNSVNKQNGHSRTTRLASVSSETNSIMWNRKDSSTSTCNSQLINENKTKQINNLKNTINQREIIELGNEKI
ncbi:adhesion G protein-coupled receptor L4-like isoform X1 [Centruroides vittatus]|uniref:adhesion G protein-coupled receptor L4-like isoform X1 n=1 Tax=Centruroides vittatus TaxID=120091 RepID=UPI0035108422